MCYWHDWLTDWILVYLSRLLHLHWLYITEWKDNCDSWIRCEVEGSDHGLFKVTTPGVPAHQALCQDVWWHQHIKTSAVLCSTTRFPILKQSTNNFLAGNKNVKNLLYFIPSCNNNNEHLREDLKDAQNNFFSYIYVRPSHLLKTACFNCMTDS